MVLATYGACMSCKIADMSHAKRVVGAIAEAGQHSRHAHRIYAVALPAMWLTLTCCYWCCLLLRVGYGAEGVPQYGEPPAAAAGQVGSPPVFVDFSVYKKQGALMVKPIKPTWAQTPNGGWKMERCAAAACRTAGCVQDSRLLAQQHLRCFIGALGTLQQLGCAAVNHVVDLLQRAMVPLVLRKLVANHDWTSTRQLQPQL